MLAPAAGVCFVAVLVNLFWLIADGSPADHNALIVLFSVKLAQMALIGAMIIEHELEEAITLRGSVTPG